MKRKADLDGLKQRSLHSFFSPLQLYLDPQTSPAAQCVPSSRGCREQDDPAATAAVHLTQTDRNRQQRQLPAVASPACQQRAGCVLPRNGGNIHHELESGGVSFAQDCAARQHAGCGESAGGSGHESHLAQPAASLQQAGGVAATQLPLGSEPRGSPEAHAAAPQASPGAAQPVDHAAAAALTAYELQRLERVRRNQEVMLSLGLGAPAAAPQQPVRPAARRPPRRRGPAAKPAAAPQAVRRSGRRRGGSEAGRTSSVPGDGLPVQQPEEEPEEELQYDDSRVRRYVCEVLAAPPTATDAGGGGLARSTDAAAPGAAVGGFRRQPGCLHDSALARAYSVDWRPGLVAAGGKDGVVSVLGSAELEGGRLASDASAPPLMSHKLHSGWVSDVQFATAAANDDGGGGGAEDATPLLLTAANDGVAALWDLGSAAVRAGGHGAAALPRCLARAADLHAGGIFSLHERGGWVVTASKDGTVAVSSLSNSGGTASLAAVQRYGQLHEGVVKCARWRPCGDARVFASCGNDRRLCVVDVRQPPGGGASLAADSAHASAVNCLRWHPTSPHLLLSASHDPALLLHDLRAPGQPLHRLLGHAAGPRIAAIYQPAFVAGGAAVATGCERSQLLSLYCTASGAAISRGDAGLTPGATFCRGGLHDPLLCTAAREVHMFLPVWAADGGR